MKKILTISILAIFTLMTGTVTATDYPEEYLGLPGDNLNLYATMKLFQESETLEGFERNLNDQNSQINNLDLNGDNYVDYISVMDYVDGNVHSIVLRTQLNRNETQDIAVFTVKRFEDGTARIQLIGDEALYGKNYIVEPIYADSQETPNPGYIGSSVVVTTPAPVTVTTYEVAAWPIIRFIFRPGYVCWRSSWSWGYYPSYWNPWRPYYWHTYYGYHSHFNHYYYAHYRYWNHHRYHRYHDFYYSNVRSYSTNVNVRIRQGNYRTTYSRPDLRKRGDELYRNTARRSTGYRADNSNTGGRTNSLKSVKSRSTNSTISNSGRRSVSDNTSRTRTNSQINRGVGNTQKSSTIRSGRSTTNASQRTQKAVNQRSGNRSTSSSIRTGTRSSANINRGVQQKSTTIKSNRNSVSSSTRNYRQPNRTSSVYSNKSASKPKVSSRSSTSGSSYRQPKVSSRSSNTKSISRPKVSTSSRSKSVKSSNSRSSGSRSSGVSSRSSQSRSSSGSRSGRR